MQNPTTKAISNLTAGERDVLAACIEASSANGYDFTFGDEIDVAGMSKSSVAGTLGSLFKKGAIAGERPVINGKLCDAAQIDFHGTPFALVHELDETAIDALLVELREAGIPGPTGRAKLTADVPELIEAAAPMIAADVLAKLGVPADLPSELKTSIMQIVGERVREAARAQLGASDERFALRGDDLAGWHVFDTERGVRVTGSTRDKWSEADAIARELNAKGGA